MAWAQSFGGLGSKAADEFAKSRGWEFQIWTEKTLQEMKIMPKYIKPLKPLGPVRKKKK